MCPGPGEEAEAAPIDDKKIPLRIIKIADLKSGRLDSNPVIRPGDYITVTEAEPVYITGSVMAPQGIYMRDQLTLSRALAMVGGARKEAKTTDVRVFRQKPGATDQEIIQVDFAAIKKNQKPDFFLQAYDVVDVPEAGMFSPGRILPTLFGAVTGGLSTAFTSGGTSIANRVIY
jgi:protein involved in polysaccharide export with SLBB domain